MMVFSMIGLIDGNRCKLRTLFVCLVDSGKSGWFDSCEYAVGGYCEEASAYSVSGVDDGKYHLSSVLQTFPNGVSDVCDMCGHVLPPLDDDNLRQKHVQVQYIYHCIHRYNWGCQNCFFTKLVIVLWKTIIW